MRSFACIIGWKTRLSWLPYRKGEQLAIHYKFKISLHPCLRHHSLSLSSHYHRPRAFLIPSLFVSVSSFLPTSNYFQVSSNSQIQKLYLTTCLPPAHSFFRENSLWNGCPLILQSAVIWIPSHCSREPILPQSTMTIDSSQWVFLSLYPLCPLSTLTPWISLSLLEILSFHGFPRTMLCFFSYDCPDLSAFVLHIPLKDNIS